MRVPDQQQRRRHRQPVAGGVLQHGPVVLVRHQRHGVVERQPAQLVDLGVGGELAADGLHQPVVDVLGPQLHGVGRAHPLATGDHPQAGLLGHLADGGLQRVLADVELALRQGPVVVPRTVHDRGHDRAVVPGSPHHAAGGGDGPAAGQVPHGPLVVSQRAHPPAP
jgi:hypothetical protein